MFDRGLFLRSITETIQCWPSFQVSILNGMGGPNQLEKLEWFYNGILQLFMDNRSKLIYEDVQDFLREILDNEFDTIIEDGSLEMIAASIYNFYEKISQGNPQYVLDKLKIVQEKYANSRQRLLNIKSSTPEPMPEDDGDENNREVNSDAEKSNEIEMEIETEDVAKNNNNNINDENENANNSDKDGWTVVRRKKR